MTTNPTSSLPPLAMSHPFGEYVTSQLTQRYRLWRAWEPAEMAEIAAGKCPARVLVTLGPKPLPLSLVDQLPKLELVAAQASGIEGIDVGALRERKLKLVNAGTLTGNDVSDMALALMLGLTRRVVSGDQFVRSGAWGQHEPPFVHSIRTLRMGIAGMGAIGMALAPKLAPLGCSIAWTGRTQRPEIPYPWYPDVPTLAANCDVLFICIRADNTNRKMIGAEVFDKLGPDGYLINVSRGTIVDEEALIAALRAKRIAGAALDVFDPEPTSAERWAGVPNVILTPHAAGHVTENHRGVYDQLIDNVRRLYAGEELLGQIL